MDFDWDPAKAPRNLRKHGVSFSEAMTIFRDPAELTMFDPDHSSSEDRYVSLGLSAAARLMVVGDVERRRTIRIIFSRRAAPRERHDYEEI